MPTRRSKAVAAGELRHRVEIERNRNAGDERGQLPEAWETIGYRWAKIETLSGGEAEKVRSVVGDQASAVTIRYFEGLTNAHRFKFGKRILNIGLVNQVEQKNEFQICTCGERA